MESVQGPPRHSERNHGMDVLRAVAIIGVLATHLANEYSAIWARPFFSIGCYGVDLFFVLSGWLLGRQLLAELQTTGTLDVRRFLARRWLRTLPAYFAILGLVFGWQLMSKPYPILDWRYLVFVQNYDFEGMPYFSSSWSLCVEEHFYLAVGPLLLIARRRSGRIMLVLLASAPTLFRLLEWYGTKQETHVRFDGCVIGVGLAALATYKPLAWSALGRLSVLWSGLVCLVLLFECLYRVRGDRVGLASTLVFAMLSGLMVIVAVQTPWLGRLRCGGLAKYVSTRSYALYLTHQFVMFAVNKFWPTADPVASVAAILVLSLATSEVLYQGVERPGMKCRERFAWSR